MKCLNFALRTAKEILRDPLNLAFGLGFPIVLIVMLSIIQANIPVGLFEIGQLTPGITVFGLAFMTLFSATLVAKDRDSAFLPRLYTTPMTAADFIFGYMLPLVPISVLQCIVCYLVALCFGLRFRIGILFAVLGVVPLSLFFIAFGLLCGCLLHVKQVGGVCGALFTNLTAWLSGVWFDISLLGGGFQKFAASLPFLHAVELERALLNGNYDAVLPHLPILIGYTAVTTLLAVLIFLRKMKK